jgi:hypothetical protein
MGSISGWQKEEGRTAGEVLQQLLDPVLRDCPLLPLPAVVESAEEAIGGWRPLGGTLHYVLAPGGSVIATGQESKLDD